MAVTVELTDWDRKIIREQAQERQRAKHDRPEWWIWYLNGRRERPHEIGLAGEFAFGKIFGLKPNLEIYEHGDLFDFGEVEVKTCCGVDDPHLIVRREDFQRKKAFAYVLARADDTLARVELIGIISRERFEREGFERDFGYGTMFAVHGSRLQPFEQAVGWFKFFQACGVIQPVNVSF